MSNDSPVTILALLAEMARCLNQNLVKVTLAPIDTAFSTSLNSATDAILIAIFECLTRPVVKPQNCTVIFLLVGRAAIRSRQS